MSALRCWPRGDGSYALAYDVVGYTDAFSKPWIGQCQPKKEPCRLKDRDHWMAWAACKVAAPFAAKRTVPEGEFVFATARAAQRAATAIRVVWRTGRMLQKWEIAALTHGWRLPRARGGDRGGGDG